MNRYFSIEELSYLLGFGSNIRLSIFFCFIDDVYASGIISVEI